MALAAILAKRAAVASLMRPTAPAADASTSVLSAALPVSAFSIAASSGATAPQSTWAGEIRGVCISCAEAAPMHRANARPAMPRTRNVTLLDSPEGRRDVRAECQYCRTAQGCQVARAGLDAVSRKRVTLTAPPA